jgi:hypothetical protein
MLTATFAFFNGGLCMEHDQVTVIACDLTVFTPEERARHDAVSAEWRRAVQGVEALPDGYGFRFEAGPDILLTLAEFVSREQRCCPFLHFAIIAEPDGGPLWLHLTGPAPVKAFLDSLIAELAEIP